MSTDFEQVVQAYLDAVKQRDLQKLLAAIGIDEDINLVLPNGAYFKGNHAATTLHSAWLADPDWKLEAQVLHITETPEMAYAFILADYSDAMLGEKPYKEQHYVSMVFVKKDGRWCLVHDQSTVATQSH